MTVGFETTGQVDVDNAESQIFTAESMSDIQPLGFSTRRYLVMVLTLSLVGGAAVFVPLSVSKHSGGDALVQEAVEAQRTLECAALGPWQPFPRPNGLAGWTRMGTTGYNINMGWPDCKKGNFWNGGNGVCQYALCPAGARAAVPSHCPIGSDCSGPGYDNPSRWPSACPCVRTQTTTRPPTCSERHDNFVVEEERKCAGDHIKMFPANQDKFRTDAGLCYCFEVCDDDPQCEAFRMNTKNNKCMFFKNGKGVTSVHKHHDCYLKKPKAP